MTKHFSNKYKLVVVIFFFYRIHVASWSEWSSWGNCTINGMCPARQERTRQCMDPWATLAACEGKANDSQTCNADKCRKLFLIKLHVLKLKEKTYQDSQIHPQSFVFQSVHCCIENCISVTRREHFPHKL